RVFGTGVSSVRCRGQVLGWRGMRLLFSRISKSSIPKRSAVSSVRARNLIAKSAPGDDFLPAGSREMRLRRGGEGESRGPPRAWAAVGREGKRSALAGDLDRLATAVPVAAAVATATALRRGRRRAAVNEALHELRRPLQALALGGGEAAGGSGPGDPLRL